jgi:glyoxylase-like metal-dependent hydrolase (beta-lactamase superfamily II)
VITHAHRSHLGGLAALKRATGATVYAHRWEADIVAGDRRAQAVSIVPHQSIRLIPFQLGLWLDRPRHDPCPVDELLDEGDAVGPLQVMHSPGHSPGHLTFWWPERGFLIAGDGIATWPNLCAGWRVFNLNHTQHKASLGAWRPSSRASSGSATEIRSPRTPRSRSSSWPRPTEGRGRA